MATKAGRPSQQQIVLLRAAEAGTPPVGAGTVVAYRFTVDGISEEFQIPGIYRVVSELVKAGLVVTREVTTQRDSIAAKEKSVLVAVFATEEGGRKARAIERNMPARLRQFFDDAGVKRKQVAVDDALRLTGVRLDARNAAAVVLDRALAVDETLLKLRKLPEDDPDVVKFYRRYLSGELSERKTTIEEYLDFLLRVRLRDFSLEEGHSLEIEIADDLSSIRMALGADSLRIQNPRLLWECSCGLPAELGGPQPADRCKIHSSPLGARFAELFGSSLVTVRFGGTEILWKNVRALWPPSIDSLWLAKVVLREHLLDGTKKIADIGSGTGFLGIHLAKHSARELEVHASDWLLTPLWATRMNAAVNGVEDSIRVHLGPDFSYAGSELPRVDAVVCNPPYLPLLGHEPLASAHTVSGTHLLEFLVKNTSRVAGRLILGCSELAYPELYESVQRTRGARLEQVGDWLTVPFRVKHTYDAPAYLEALKQKRSLIENTETAFRYWHRVGVFSITFP